MKNNYLLNLISTKGKSWQFSFTLLLIMVMGISSFAQTITIGAGTSHSRFPLGSVWGFERSASIYTAAEVSLTGNVTRISWYSNTANAKSRPIKIYLKNTTDATFTASTWASQTIGATLVYDSSKTIIEGWNEFDLTDPTIFNFTGGSKNLLVLVETNSGGGGIAGSAGEMRYSTAANKHLFLTADSNAPTGNGSVNDLRPNLQIWFPSPTIPNCAVTHFPANLATGIVKNPILTWADGGAGPTSYDMYFGTATNPPFVGNQAGTSYKPALSTLASNTTYYWKVVPKNLNGSATGCVEHSFTTGTGFNYCTVGSGGTSDFISAFSTTLATSNVGYTTASHPVDAYENLTGQDFQVSQGTSFDFSNTYNTVQNGLKIWIDYDNNGVFDGAEEVFYLANPNVIKTGTITVPFATPLGIYRMRVRCQFGYGAISPPSCGIVNYGSTLDFALNVIPPPTCIAPTGLSATDLTTSSAILNWTTSTSNPPNGYDYFYSTSNTAPTALTTPNGSVGMGITTASIASLVHSTNYYYWIRANCGGGDKSSWSVRSTFKTACATIATLSQNFDSMVVGIVLPNCWNRVVKGTGALNISTNGPASGTLNMEMIGNGVANQSMAVLPEFSNVNAGTHWLKFKTRTSTGNATLKFGYVNGAATIANFVELQSLSFSNTNYVNADKYIFVPISVPAGARLAFFNSGVTSESIYIDDVIWEQLPACIIPTSLASSLVTFDSATISWTASSSNPTNGYDVYYNINPTAPSAGTTPSVNNHTASPLALNGLSSSSKYYWWVRSDCSTETSIWSFGGSFSTLCGLSNIPYSMPIQTTIMPALPLCTTVQDVNNDGRSWITYHYTTSGGIAQKVMQYQYSTVNDANDWLFTNSLVLATGESYQLKFKYNSNYVPHNFKVAIGSSAINSAMTTSLFTIEGTEEDDVLHSKVIPFTVSTSGNYTIGFQIYSPAEYPDFEISEISVVLVPSCVVPTNLVTSSVTTTTANLSWTASSSNPSNGYEYYYATSSTAPTGSTSPSGSVGIGVTSVSLTSLNIATIYYFWVRSNCGSGLKSNWTGLYNFSTLCSPNTIPYTLNFATAVVPNMPNCTTSQNAGSGNNWTTSVTPGLGFVGNVLKYSFSLLQPANAWFYTQGLTLEAGNLYAISYDFANSNNSYSEKMKIAVGTSPTSSEMTNVIENHTNISSNLKELASANFMPTTTGVYYFGFNVYSAANQFNLYVNNIKVDRCPTGIWLGTTSSDWNTASNWEDNMIPEACTPVRVTTSNPLVVASNTTVKVKSIYLSANAVVTVNGTLNVGNVEVVSGGQMTISNDAALLQKDAAINTGLVTVKRNSTSLFRLDYTLWSSPVFEPNLRNFSPLTLFNRFYTYGYNSLNQPNGGYSQEIFTTDDVTNKKFAPAKGYLIRMPNSTSNPVVSGYAEGATSLTHVGSFTGNLNNGEITIPLHGLNAGINNGYTLVGNPYPSPIKISWFLNANSQITSTLYFWRKKNSVNPLNAGSGYVTTNNVGMVSNDPEISGQTLTHIKTGQGFFVKAIGASPSPLNFRNNMRESETTTGIFFKSSAENTNELHRFWLNLFNQSNLVGQTLIAYATDANQGVDNIYDAPYFNDSQLALTSIIDSNEYIIQGRSLPFQNTDVVALGFKTNAAGNFTISLSNFDGLFAQAQDIFLKDKTTNTVQNLKTNSYTFTSPLGVFNDRFEVQYDGALGTENPIFDANNILIAVKYQQIKINAGSIIMEKIELIDVAGRVIYTQESINGPIATIDNITTSNQMLLVRITTVENGVVNQKILF